jgi:hypothetical protein
MSSSTARILLVKETTLENYNVTTVNNDSDKIDAAVGFEECTNSTRPSAPYNGKGIRESDTGSVLLSNGSSPASGSWIGVWASSGPVVVGAVGTAAPLRGQTTSTIAGNRLLDARKFGETQPAFTLDFDGKHQWGPGGSTAPDTNLYRSAADTLRTDDALYVGGALTVVGTVTGSVSRGSIAWGRRTTISSTSTSSTALGVLRIDNIALKAGRAYTIATGTLHPTSTVNTDNIRLEIRISTSGTATTSSSVLVGAQAYEVYGNTSMLRAKYVPGADQTVSILLCVARESGTGNVQLYADGTRITEMDVIDDGPSVSNTGTAV